MNPMPNILNHRNFGNPPYSRNVGRLTMQYKKSQVIQQLFQILFLLTSHKVIVFCFKLLMSSTLKAAVWQFFLLCSHTPWDGKHLLLLYCLRLKRPFCAIMTTWYRSRKLGGVLMLWYTRVMGTTSSIWSTSYILPFRKLAVFSTSLVT